MQFLFWLFKHEIVLQKLCINMILKNDKQPFQFLYLISLMVWSALRKDIYLFIAHLLLVGNLPNLFNFQHLKNDNTENLQCE